VKLSEAFDQDPTDVDEREGVLTVARSPVSRRRGSGQIVDAGEVLVVPRDVGDADGVQKTSASSITWSSSSNTSCGEAGEWLEWFRAAVTLGWRWRRRIAAEEFRRRGQGEAPGRGRKVGGDREHGVHRGCRIGAVMPADVRGSGERFCRPGGAISRESGRGSKRGWRPSYRRRD
jgi:hypothetical protein